MNAIIRQEENLQKIRARKDFLHRPHEEFYRFCVDTGKSYWLLYTALGFGISLKEDLRREFSHYLIDLVCNKFALMEIKVRRDEHYRENPFYKG